MPKSRKRKKSGKKGPTRSTSRVVSGHLTLAGVRWLVFRGVSKDPEYAKLSQLLCRHLATGCERCAAAVASLHLETDVDTVVASALDHGVVSLALRRLKADGDRNLEDSRADHAEAFWNAAQNPLGLPVLGAYETAFMGRAGGSPIMANLMSELIRFSGSLGASLPDMILFDAECYAVPALRVFDMFDWWEDVDEGLRGISDSLAGGVCARFGCPDVETVAEILPVPLRCRALMTEWALRYTPGPRSRPGFRTGHRKALPRIRQRDFQLTVAEHGRSTGRHLDSHYSQRLASRCGRFSLPAIL